MARVTSFATAVAAAGAVWMTISLPVAVADGGQMVRTESGKVRCWVTASGTGTTVKGPVVICEASSPMSPPFDQWENNGFLNGPMTSYGSHYHAAVVDAAGNFSFQDGGNLGGSSSDGLVLQYGQTYNLQGWTIVSGPDGTRFTNSGTGRGMFVSIENVYAF